MSKFLRTAPVDPRRARIDNSIYETLGDSWWNPEGTMSPLHSMTPARLAYFDRVFSQILPPERRRPVRFIDVGCGGGILTEALAARGYPISGFDLSRGALEAAQIHSRESGVNLPYGRSSAYHLGIRTGSVDGVIASDLFEHLHDFPRAASEMSRVLKPGGILAFDTVNRTWLSFLGAIWVVQKWLRLLPPHTHAWNLFITPGELKSVFSASALEVREIRGLSPAANPVFLFFKLWRKGQFGPYRISADLRISYIGYAVKISSNRMLKTY